MRISGGMAGLVASSSNGSPGAIARMPNRMTLIPSRLGMAMRIRRMMYWRFTTCDSSRVLVPVLDIPGVVVPAAHGGHQLAGQGLHGGTGDDRDHGLVVHHHVVQLDEHRGALDGIDLHLGGFVDIVVLLVPPTRDVAALPLVLLAGRLL